jgi:hypothetical protein
MSRGPGCWQRGIFAAVEHYGAARLPGARSPAMTKATPHQKTGANQCHS